MIGRSVKIRLFFLTLLLAYGPLANAESKEYGSVYVAEVTSIYDGDTFRVNIAGWPNIIGERMPIRIAGIDTPEIRTKCKKEKELARQAKQLTVGILRDAKEIELRNLKRGMYFRIIADVYADGVSVGEKLISAGLAYRYDGGTKKSWCE